MCNFVASNKKILLKQQIMVKHLQFKSWLLMMLLLIGSGSAWAGEVTDTYLFTSKSWTATLNDVAANWTSGKEGAGYSNNGIQVTKNSTGANGTSPVSYENITKIVVTYNTNTSKGAGTIAVKIGVNDETSKDANYSSGDDGTKAFYTVEYDYDTPQSGDVKLTVNTTTNSIYLCSVAITYTTGGGSVNPSLQESDFSLGGSSALTFDLYNNSDAQVINYTTSSTGKVTVGTSEYVNAVVNENNKTITVTPLKKTSDAVEIEVNQVDDDTYAAGSATFTVTITDSTPKAGAWVETALSDIASDDVFVIVGNNGANYALTNDNGTGSAPAAIEVTIENGEITSDVADNIKWNVGGNATDGYTFYPDGTTETWLYCTNTNNGVRVGDNVNAAFTISEEGYLFNTATSRYIGVYNSQDWRCYTSPTTNNIKDQSFKFYKYADNSAVKSPVITVEETFVGSTTATIDCATEGATIYYSYDNEYWNEYTAALNITATTTIYAKATKDDAESKVVSKTTTKTLPTPIVTISGELTVDLDGETDVDAGQLTAAVTYNEVAVDGATVTWSGDNDAVATIDAATGAVTIKSRGTVTFTATYAGNDNYAQATATKTITVTDSKAPGTEGKPYTVAEAIEAIDAIDAGTGVTGVYATGIVSKIVTPYSSQYGNISYNISADGTTDGDQLQAYRGKSYNGENFTSEDDIQVGDVVVIYGNLTKYGNTYEFGANNQLVSLKRVVPTYPLDVTAGVHGTVAVTVDGEAWDGQTEIAQGATVELTATPAEGWAFTSWTVEGVELEDATANPVSFKMAGEVMIEATYADATTSYDVVVVDVDGGFITSDKESAKAGEKVVISYEREEGYAFGEWVVEDGDGNPVSVSYENEEYSFTMPANDVQISATYKKIHTVLYSVAGVDGEAERIDGDALNLNVPEAVNGMAFAGWSTTDDLNAPEFVANDAAVTNDMILFAMFTAKSGSTFNKVTTTEDLTSGDYLIVYEAEKMAFDGSLETLDAVSNAIRVDISDNKIAATAETNAAVFTIDTENGTLRSASGYYIGVSSNANALKKSENADEYTNSFSIDEDGNAVISAVFAESTMTLRYNSASNQNRFRYFKSGQQAIQLYKKVAGDVYTLAVPVEASISAAKYATFHSDKNVYFSTSDVEVYTAHYNGSYVELTEVADGLVPANTAVVLHKDVDEKTTVEAYEVGDVEELTNNGLKISDGATAVGNGIYVLSNKSHGVGFYHWASDQSLSDGKVYIEIPAAGEAREFIGMVAGGSTTGISEVTSHAAQQSGVIYDLQGRKVETLKRGLYIINGKKAIIK